MRVNSSKEKKPECPVGNHTDHIVPIIYGMPPGKIMEQAEKGLVHLGGCAITDRDPKYYCQVHKKEF